jgi:hypothetical protein
VHFQNRNGLETRICDLVSIQVDQWRDRLSGYSFRGKAAGTVDPNLETELETDVRFLPWENPGT